MAQTVLTNYDEGHASPYKNVNPGIYSPIRLLRSTKTLLPTSLMAIAIPYEASFDFGTGLKSHYVNNTIKVLTIHCKSNDCESMQIAEIELGCIGITNLGNRVRW